MKSIAFRAIRILLSVALLAWVLNQAKLDELWARLVDAKWEWLLAAFAVNSLGNLFGAWRWRLLLRSQGRKCSTPFLFGSYMVGLFFNNFLPSTIGGDVVRAASAKNKGGGTLTEHLTVVLVERMIGLLATLSLGGIAALTGEAARLDPRVPWILGGALLAAVTGLYLALATSVRRPVIQLMERLPLEPAATDQGLGRLLATGSSFLRRTAGKMLAAFELFSQARPALVANYFLSLGFQFLLIVHFFLIQFAFGEAVPFPTYIVVVPLVFCVMILPVGINGLGLRETAFVWFLTRAGMDPATALAISLASYGIAVTQGLLGGLVHLSREMRGSRLSTEPDAPVES